MSKPSSSVLQHVQFPRNVGKLDNADAIGRSSLNGQAPYTHLYLSISGDRITDARFETFGCGFSIAACSMLTELVKGRAIGEAFPVTAEEVLENLGGMPDHKKFCAKLAIEALVDAVYQWRRTQTGKC